MTSKPILNDVGLFFKKRFCIFAMHKKNIMESKKESTYIIDKWEDGSYEMHKHDRTYKNKCADTKGQVLGKLIELISKELDHMENYDSLNITFWKY